MFQSLSRRDFLKGMGVGIAALNLPFINITEAAEIRDKKDFYVAKINQEIFQRIKGKSYKHDCTLPIMTVRCQLMICAICIFFIRTLMA